jgi:prepilin-type N-terminal cleavage/methylation domain-containing protein
MRSFTLIELIMVVVIIGVLVTFAAPAFRVTRDRALENEARANLSLIQSAQKIYRMEMGNFINCAAGTPYSACLNLNLKLEIPQSSVWTYASPSAGCAQAARTGHQLRLQQSEDTAVPDVLCP